MLKSAVIVNLNSCDNSCLFCKPSRVRKVLTEVELKDIEIDLFRQVLDLKKRGLDEYLEISGSDPIQYNGIVRFIKYIKRDLNFKTIMLSTHGRNMHNLKLVKELERSGLDKLRIPLYGSNGKIHDSVTQEKGSFEETLKGVQNVFRHAPEIKITITSLIMKQNYKDGIKILRLACKYASEIIFSIPCIPRIKSAEKFVVSFDKMRPYLKRFLEASDKASTPLNITDIPFCVFGFDKKIIFNISGPPVTSNTYSIPKPFKSAVPNLPNYRVKRKLPVCHNCALAYKCDGFYNNYLLLMNSFPFKPLQGRMID